MACTHFISEAGDEFISESGDGFVTESSNLADCAAEAVAGSTGKWLLLADFEFESGTQYHSSLEVEHPSYTYEARVIEWGYVDRSIPVPSGLFQGGDVRIRLADTDRQFRRQFAGSKPTFETPRRRLFSLRMMPAGASKADYLPFGTFEVYDAEFGPGDMTIYGRDITFSWIDKPINGLGTRANFSYLMDGTDEFFFPILQGVIESSAEGSPPAPQGAVALPRMTLARWALAQTPIVSATVYRKLPTDDAFVVVTSGGNWAITEEPHTIDGVDYNLSFLDFLADQPDGTEVRVDAEGIWFRGDFGTDAHGAFMASVFTSPISAIRNPIDFLINILYGLLANEPRLTHWNIQSFIDTRNTLETILEGSPATGYLCDGAITEPITAREFLSRFLTSFELDLFVNRLGELTVGITPEEDEDAPVFSDGPVFGNLVDNSLIIINSVRQRLAQPTINRCRYNFGRNYATNEWATKDIYDNDDDQLTLGGDASPPVPQIEEDTLELWFVRDPETAGHVTVRRMEFLTLGSYRIELQMPLPEVYDDIELAALMKITHRWGIDTDGYDRAAFKTTGLTYDLDRKLCIARGVLRQRLEPEPTDCTEFTAPEVYANLGAGEVTDSLGGFNSVTAIAVSENWINIGLNKATATFNNDFAFAPRRPLPTIDGWSNPSLPYSINFVSGLVALSDEIVYVATALGNDSRMYQFDRTPGTFTNLNFPDSNVDRITLQQSTTDTDIVYVMTQARILGGDGATIWTYRISTDTFTQIGGDTLNGSWNLPQNNANVTSVAEGTDGFIYVAVGGGTANLAQIWRGNAHVTPTSWTRIAGVSGENGGWSAGTNRSCRCLWHDGYLYAGLLGATNGDAKGWRWDGATWLNIAGNSVNGSWANGTKTGAQQIFVKGDLLGFGLTGTTAGDAEVWFCSTDDYQFTKNAGDGEISSWSGRTGVTASALDPAEEAYLYIGIGSLTNQGRIYGTTIPCAEEEE